MSREEQATAYLREATLTLQAAHAIYEAATPDTPLWAQVVKNAYDAIEQAVSRAIAAQGERIPRKHPAKINTFLTRYAPGDEMEDTLLYWLQRRSDAQYVDIRGDMVAVPHTLFDQDDAERILDDAELVLAYVRQETDLSDDPDYEYL